jgi:hypothetical protein
MRTYRTAMTFRKSKRIANWKDHCLKVWGLTQVPGEHGLHPHSCVWVTQVLMTLRFRLAAWGAK